MSSLEKSLRQIDFFALSFGSIIGVAPINKNILQWTFVSLTIVKAAYITN